MVWCWLRLPIQTRLTTGDSICRPFRHSPIEVLTSSSSLSSSRSPIDLYYRYVISIAIVDIAVSITLPYSLFTQTNFRTRHLVMCQQNGVESTTHNPYLPAECFQEKKDPAEDSSVTILVGVEFLFCNFERGSPSFQQFDGKRRECDVSLCNFKQQLLH